MATPIATDLGTLLLAVKTRLIAEDVCTDSAVYLGLTPEMPAVPPDDRFVVIVPTAQTPDQGVITGGGNAAMLMAGEMHLHLWVRLDTDEVPRSENWLTDISVGSLAALRAMVKALQLHQPTDTAGNGLTYTGLKLLGIDTAKRGGPPGGKAGVTAAPGWGCITTRWSLKWWFSLA